MKKLVFTLALCLVASVSFAQKDVLNDVKKGLKAKNPSFYELKGMMKQVLVNAETSDLAESWFVAGSLENKQFDNEMYINGQQDQGTMYEALDNIYPNFAKAYELDIRPNEKGEVKPKYAKDMKSLMKANRVQYFNAGLYYFDIQEWKKAADDFEMYVNMSSLPLMEGERFQNENDTFNLELKYYAGLASMYIPDYPRAERLLNEVKGTGVNELEVYQLLGDIYNITENEEKRIELINEGRKAFPTNEYFVLNLIDVSLNKGDIDTALNYLNEAIKAAPGDPFWYNILGQVYYQNEMYTEAVNTLTKSLEINPNLSESNMQMGNAYKSQAQDIRLQSDELGQSDKAKSDKLYMESLEIFKKAAPYYEKAVELDPENQNALINLNDVYYKLNDHENYYRTEDMLKKMLGVE